MASDLFHMFIQPDTNSAFILPAANHVSHQKRPREVFALETIHLIYGIPRLHTVLNAITVNARR